MNSEERIIEMLEQINSRLDSMEGRLVRVESNQAEMRNTLTKHSERMDEMQDTLTRVAVTQEGVVLSRIQLALEGHDELRRKMDTLATKKQVEDLAGDVDIIKDVVSQHSGDISKLKKAL